jgi:hypothetical protein
VDCGAGDGGLSIAASRGTGAYRCFRITRGAYGKLGQATVLPSDACVFSCVMQTVLGALFPLSGHLVCLTGE